MPSSQKHINVTVTTICKYIELQDQNIPVSTIMSEKKSPPRKEKATASRTPQSAKTEGKSLKRKLFSPHTSQPEDEPVDRKGTPKRRKGSIGDSSSPSAPKSSGAIPRISVPLSERQQMALLMQMTAENSSPDSPRSPQTPLNSIRRPSKESSGNKRINKRNERGETSLHLASIKGDVKLIKKLIKQGADVNVTDFAGWTPLHEACNHGWFDVAKQLLKAGATVNVQGLDDDTPLHDASINGHEKLVELLVRHGANPLQCNAKGKTALDVAASDAIMKLLKKEIITSSSDESSPDEARSPTSPESLDSDNEDDRTIEAQGIIDLLSGKKWKHNIFPRFQDINCPDKQQLYEAGIVLSPACSSIKGEVHTPLSSRRLSHCISRLSDKPASPRLTLRFQSIKPKEDCHGAQDKFNEPGFSGSKYPSYSVTMETSDHFVTKQEIVKASSTQSLSSSPDSDLYDPHFSISSGKDETPAESLDLKKSDTISPKDQTHVSIEHPNRRDTTQEDGVSDSLLSLQTATTTVSQRKYSTRTEYKEIIDDEQQNSSCGLKSSIKDIINDSITKKDNSFLFLFAHKKEEKITPSNSGKSEVKEESIDPYEFREDSSPKNHQHHHHHHILNSPSGSERDLDRNNQNGKHLHGKHELRFDLKHEKHDLRHELRHEAKHDLRHESKHDLRHDVKHELRHDLSKHDGKYDLRHEPKHDGKYELRHDGKYDLRHEIKYDLRHEGKYELRHDLRHEFRHDPRYDSKYESKSDIRHEVKHESKHDLKYDVRHDSKHELKHDVKHELEFSCQSVIQSGGQSNSTESESEFAKSPLRVPPLRIVIPPAKSSSDNSSDSTKSQGLPYIVNTVSSSSNNNNNSNNSCNVNNSESRSENRTENRSNLEASIPSICTVSTTTVTTTTTTTPITTVAVTTSMTTAITTTTTTSVTPSQSETKEVTNNNRTESGKIKEETEERYLRITRQRAHAAASQANATVPPPTPVSSCTETVVQSEKDIQSQAVSQIQTRATHKFSDPQPQVVLEETPNVELHPRKRKLRPREASTCINEQPTPPGDDLPLNSLQLYLNIRKQIQERRKHMYIVQPKPPQGFKDYLMNKCSYVLQGNAASRLSVPILSPPQSVTGPMSELFIEQEKERYKLRLQHLIEKEKLVLSVEQEILRVHGRAARALANQSVPLSVCSILKDEEIYNTVEPEQEEKDKNVRSRYNGRQFLSWLQDVDDKYDKIKEAMLLRHHNEAEALHAVQKMEWEWKLREQSLCDIKTTPVIDDVHVPMVHVNDDFDLLPA